MEYRTYLVFPDSENNILLLGDETKAYIDIVFQIQKLKGIFKTKTQFKLWYDSQNVSTFIAKAKTIVDGKYLDSIDSQIRILLRNGQDICSNSNISQDCSYLRLSTNWSFIDASRVMKEATEVLNLSAGTITPIIFSISGGVDDENRDSINIIKDAPHVDDMPSLARIPFFREEMEFRAWIENIIGPGNFSLRNKKRFIATGKFWIQQMIYKELNTSYYWYFDFFHKDNRQHYEVFDAVGDHLGEAGIDGILINGTKDTKKKIGNII